MGDYTLRQMKDRSLTALYLEVDRPIADDVRKYVDAREKELMDELAGTLRENEELRQNLETIGRARDNALHMGGLVARENTKTQMELAAIRALVEASDRCAFRFTPQHSPCNETRAWHEQLGEWDTHPFTPESTLDAAKRMAAMVMTDESCKRAASVIVHAGRPIGTVAEFVAEYTAVIKQARGAKE